MLSFEKWLFVFLMSVFTTLTVNASTIWPFGYLFLTGSKSVSSLGCIIIGFIVEIGFVKYFTKVSYSKSALVSLCMSLASGVFGIILSVVVYIMVCLMVWAIGDNGYQFIIRAFNIKVNTDTGEALFFTAILILAIISAVFINPLIEGFIVKLTLKLKIKKTYKWLLAANAISIAICITLFLLTH